MNILKKTINTILLIMLWCFLVSFTACTSQEEQTQVEQQIQQNEIKKGMTKVEQEYFAQAQPDIEQLLKEINEMGRLVSNAKTIEELKEAIPVAENCVTLGNKIKQLEVTEELKTLSNLVTLFGWYAEQQGETFIKALETNDTEELKDWIEICWPDTISYMYQLTAYIQEGKTIQEQLEQELIGILSEEEIEQVYVSDCVAVFGLNEESTENALKKIYNILKLMCAQHKYDYLSKIRIGVDYSEKIDGKTWTFMYVEFNDSRKQIDFNTFQWSNIPEVADVYQNQMD